MAAGITHVALGGMEFWAEDAEMGQECLQRTQPLWKPRQVDSAKNDFQVACADVGC